MSILFLTFVQSLEKAAGVTLIYFEIIMGSYWVGLFGMNFHWVKGGGFPKYPIPANLAVITSGYGRLIKSLMISYDILQCSN